MRLGTETGSAINYLMSGLVGAPKPVVGMGATILGWTDRRPATIVAVSASGKTIAVQEDSAERVDTNGQSENQDYIFTPNPKAAVRKYRLGKSGYRELGSAGRGQALAVGVRSKYHDYSF